MENVTLRLLSDLFNDSYNKSSTHLYNEYLPTNGTYQIQGQVVLLSKLPSCNNHLPPITSSELTARIKHSLAYTLTSESEVWRYIDNLKKSFIPAVRVYFIRPVDQPLELIKSHLYTRLMKNFV